MLVKGTSKVNNYIQKTTTEIDKKATMHSRLLLLIIPYNTLDFTFLEPHFTLFNSQRVACGYVLNTCVSEPPDHTKAKQVVIIPKNFSKFKIIVL